jgi:hypothetical protein
MVDTRGPMHHHQVHPRYDDNILAAVATGIKQGLMGTDSVSGSMGLRGEPEITISSAAAQV